MADTTRTAITLAHGNGGKLSHEIYSSLIMGHFANRFLAPLSDAAILEPGNRGIAFTTDSYVVKPVFFPGADIGKLAVCGTINDLAVSGARPLFLSCALIIEDGFPYTDLDRILASMSETASSCGVDVVTGDTKVVGRGAADGIYINTAGIGRMDSARHIPSPHAIEAGDCIIINGPVGDHGIAILTSRGEFPLQSGVVSDCAPLSSLIGSVLDATKPGDVRQMRDPTRGGLATTLNEIVRQTKFSFTIDEARIPIRDEVRSICEMTGYDPLYIANEGKVVFIVAKHACTAVLEAIRSDPLGRDASLIGEVTPDRTGSLIVRTQIGGERIVDMLSSDMFPRIC
jgi:hydrogenase expression/formation protein HypE